MDETVFLPYQQKWMADTSQVKVGEKSRRIGLTWAEAADSVLTAAADAGEDVFYISYNMEFTKEFVQTCAGWAKSLGRAASEMEEILIKDEDKDVTAYRIAFPSGHKILGLPSRPTTLRGRQGRVIIDEAAFCDNLGELLKAALALLMWGGDVRIISTHNGEDNPFNEMVKDIRSGKVPYSLHRTTINDALEQGLYKRICLRTGKTWTKAAEKKWLDDLVKTYGDGASEELFCIPSKSGSKYLSRALVEASMDKAIPVLKWEQSDDFTYLAEEVRQAACMQWIAEDLAPILEQAPELPSFVGEDFGRSGDLSVVAIQQEIMPGFLKALCYVEMRNVPFAQQYQVICFIIDHLKRFYGSSLDARGNGQMIAELLAQKYGPGYVNQVMISRQFYMEYFPKYKARFEDQGVKIPYSLDILEDHRLVAIEKGVPLIPDGRTSEDAGRKKLRHGDSVVAGLMIEHAYSSTASAYQPFEYEPCPPASSFSKGVDDENW